MTRNLFMVAQIGPAAAGLFRRLAAGKAAPTLKSPNEVSIWLGRDRRTTARRLTTLRYSRLPVCATKAAVSQTQSCQMQISLLLQQLCPQTNPIVDWSVLGFNCARTEFRRSRPIHSAAAYTRAVTCRTSDARTLPISSHFDLPTHCQRKFSCASSCRTSLRYNVVPSR